MERIYLVDSELLDELEIDKDFNDLTDEEVVELCEVKDKDRDYHDRFNSIESMAGYWNADEILYPNASYMRVIKNRNLLKKYP